MPAASKAADRPSFFSRGDLEVRCLGKGRLQQKETENGMVYRCAGRRGGQVILLGSRFKLRGFATHYRVLLPAGASGSFHGRFVQCDPAAAASSCRGPRRDGERPTPAERGGRPAPVEDEEEIPSLEELAGMLEAVEG